MSVSTPIGCGFFCSKLFPPYTCANRSPTPSAATIARLIRTGLFVSTAILPRCSLHLLNRYSFQLVFKQFSLQCIAVDSEQPACRRAIAARTLEHPADERPLQNLDRFLEEKASIHNTVRNLLEGLFHL